jgi:hypothetical protein
LLGTKKGSALFAALRQLEQESWNPQGLLITLFEDL